MNFKLLKAEEVSTSHHYDINSFTRVKEFLFFWEGVFLSYGGSQAMGLIGTVAASPRQSHSNAGSKPCL